MVKDESLNSELARLKNKANKLQKILGDVSNDLLALESAINEYTNPSEGGYQQFTLKQDIDQLIRHLDQRIEYLLGLEQNK